MIGTTQRHGNTWIYMDILTFDRQQLHDSPSHVVHPRRSDLTAQDLLPELEWETGQKKLSARVLQTHCNHYLVRAPKRH